MQESHWYDFILSGIIALVVWRKRLLKLVMILQLLSKFVFLFKRREFMEMENIKKVIVIAAKLGNVAGKAFEDGKITISDLALLPDFAMLFPSFIAVEWTKILPEAKDLLPEQAAELVALFNQEFDIPQDSKEHTIESVLAIVGQLIGVIANLMTILKKPAASV